MMQVSTGGLAFQDIRECGKYYVDKSLLIKDILDADDSGVFLYTRPRRFGKTTNITMLDAFFNIEYSGNGWFDGLKIMDHPEYGHYMNAFPVVFLRLSTASSESFSEFLSSMRMIIVREFERHPSVMEPGFMTPSERHLYETLSDDTAVPNRVATSVAVLCDMLRRSSGRNVVILIDEYDKALTNSFGMPHQDEIARFMTDFMNATIKENRSRQMAYITGVTQVAKAGFFSGANNLWVDNIFNTRSGERFGFTDAEVRDILSYYGHPERFDEVRDWYDGYRFGDVEVYNPFSVMMYVSKGFVPDSYLDSSFMYSGFRKLTYAIFPYLKSLFMKI